MTGPSTALCCTDVVRSYRPEGDVPPLSVLRGASLSVERGQLALLMGPSGSGKSTLLSVLAGLLRPEAGSVWLTDVELTRLRDREVDALRRKSVGFVFQGFHLFEPLTALENVSAVLHLRGTAPGPAHEQAMSLLKEVGLEGRAKHRPRQLSQGQKQRVAIARAMAGEPAVLFGDEPTASLDAESGASVMELLRAYADRGHAVLVVTHDGRLRAHADRTFVLENGRVSVES